MAAALCAVALLTLPVACTRYDVPGGDRPWPRLSDVPARPDPEETEKRRRRLLGQYGDPIASLPRPGTTPERPPAGSLHMAAIQFAKGDAALDDGSHAVLEQVAAYAKQSRATVWLFGHTSQRIERVATGGPRAAAVALATERVRAVAVALVEQGVPPDRVELVARGNRDPAYREGAVEGEAANRRVDIYFTR